MAEFVADELILVCLQDTNSKMAGEAAGRRTNTQRTLMFSFLRSGERPIYIGVAVKDPASFFGAAGGTQHTGAGQVDRSMEATMSEARHPM